MTGARFGVVQLLLVLLEASLVDSMVLYASVGTSLTLPCEGVPGSDVEWYFKQEGQRDLLLVAKLHSGSFSPGSGFQGRVGFSNLKKPGNYSLTLSPVVFSDYGIYKCQSEDDTGFIVRDWNVRILAPSSIPIVVGNSAILPCFGHIKKHTSIDGLVILWRRGREMVYQFRKGEVTYGPGFENGASVSLEQALHGNLSLTIRQTRFPDQGDYQCFYGLQSIIYSEKEPGVPNSASLIVTGHPPLTLSVKAGDSLSIPLYTADPVRVTFSDQVVMLYDNKGPATYGEHCAQRCEFLAQNYTLLVRSVTLEDAGVYNVTDPETNKTISSVSLQVSGDSQGDCGRPVAEIVLFVLGGLGVLVLLVAFYWKYRNTFRGYLSEKNLHSPYMCPISSPLTLKRPRV